MWSVFDMIRVHCGNLVTVNVKFLHVLYDSYGPQYLIWNRYPMVPPYLIWNRYCMVPHMWSVFMSYMTLMVPHTLYGRGIIWSPTCTYVPPTCIVCLLWSTILYMEQVSDSSPYLIWNRYCMVPHMYIWSPNMWSVCMSNMIFMVPHTLYGIGVVWSPHIPHTLYGVGILLSPLTLYGKCII